MTNKVFIPHPVTRMTENGLVPKFPLAPALRHGELVTVFGNSGMAAMPDAAVNAICDVLEEHKFDPNRDFFLVAGDPTIYGLMIESALMHYNMRPRLLRWDRDRKDYDVLPAKSY